MAPSGQLSGWFDKLWPVLQQGSGVTLLAMLLLLGLMVTEVQRSHRHNLTLVERLLDTKEKQIAWLEKHVHCAPAADN